MTDLVSVGGPSERVLDPARLAAVQRSGLLGVAADPRFDDLARSAARLLSVPLAILTVVDDRWSYWKSCAGPAAGAESRDRPVAQSLCQYVIAADDEVVVADAQAEPAMRDNPSVAGRVGSWAGFPLRSEDGHVLGTLCVIDSVIRRWSEDDVQTLRLLARSACSELAYRQAAGSAQRARQLAVHLSREVRTAQRRSIRLAAAIRNSLVPHGRWSLGAIEVATNVTPGRDPAAGCGTFIDIAQVPPDRWAIAMGSVSTRSGDVEPAAIAVFVRQALRAHGMSGRSLAEVLRGVDHAVFDRFGAFGPEVSCAAVWLRRTESGLVLDSSGAGRIVPAIRAADGRLRWLEAHSLPLGNEVGPLRAVREDLLRFGEALIFVNEAVLVAGGPAHEPFGRDRMAGVLRVSSTQDPSEAAQALGEAAARHSAGPPDDDLVVMVVEPARSPGIPVSSLDGR